MFPNLSPVQAPPSPPEVLVLTSGQSQDELSGDDDQGLCLIMTRLLSRAWRAVRDFIGAVA